MRPEHEARDVGKLLEFAAGLRQLIMPSPEVLADTNSLLYQIVSLSDKQMPIKAYLDLVREIQDRAKLQKCSEDVFMACAAFLALEISKLGAVYYLKGESPDYRETKRNRIPQDLRNESLLKMLAGNLARPNDRRGRVENEMIVASINRLRHLIMLSQRVHEVAKRLNQQATKQAVILEFGLTLTDYDTIIRMARRDKLIVSRAREKDPENRYELRNELHAKVKAFAEERGFTPRRALNEILDDFFSMIERHRALGASSLDD
jgi:hypothetical protein